MGGGAGTGAAGVGMFAIQQSQQSQSERQRRGKENPFVSPSDDNPFADDHAVSAASNGATTTKLSQYHTHSQSCSQNHLHAHPHSLANAQSRPQPRSKRKDVDMDNHTIRNCNARKQDRASQANDDRVMQSLLAVLNFSSSDDADDSDVEFSFGGSGVERERALPRSSPLAMGTLSPRPHPSIPQTPCIPTSTRTRMQMGRTGSRA
ncbi:hypothetical protein BD410DRAFT_359581 [Rickenella mellea]|uniref:Uncharacterized protein n=1 Tax=Rickenella mellea TaxID=50990 RepID=A0A4Y7Q1V3_9AGAM|nr:hypothetical protein BD410DRAFT_359581 [Rickenella mellea]